MKIVMLVVVLLIQCVLAVEATIFETTFDGLPDGWTNNGWTFPSGNAYIHEWVYQGTAHDGMYSEADAYFVPDGTDSLVIDISHSIELQGAYSLAWVRLYTTSMGDMDIFYELAFQSSYESSDPIHFVVEDPPDDTFVGFRFYGYVAAGTPEWSSITWTVFDMSVKAYGEDLGLDGGTWGSIKGCFQSSS